MQTRAELRINWTGVKLTLNAHGKQIRRQMVTRKRRYGYARVDLHPVSLAHILRGMFYFQPSRKLPDSAGSLHKGEKEQMLLKSSVARIFGRNVEIKVGRVGALEEGSSFRYDGSMKWEKQEEKGKSCAERE